jgi:uncharacterized protein
VHINSNNKVGKPGKTYCVFNQTRESFLSLNVTLTDTHVGRLKGLVGRLRLRGDEGIWIVPSQGVHTVGVLFAVDLIYLDRDNRVIHLEESFGRFRIGPVRTAGASVLELPPRTIYSSQTHVGDQLLICSPEAMQEFLGGNNEARSKVESAEGTRLELGQR